MTRYNQVPAQYHQRASGIATIAFGLISATSAATFAKGIADQPSEIGKVGVGIIAVLFGLMAIRGICKGSLECMDSKMASAATSGYHYN